jgi:NADH dehydrogenase
MNVVTGAFGYIGRHIARHLLEAGEPVRTITTHIGRPSPFAPGAIEVAPYSFDDPERLAASLRGATTLYNTYWVRFEHGGMTFDRAVRNTATLFECAKRAGVSKIVHMSVSNASADSPLPYYRGKALQEQALVASGVPYAVVRPTLVFGLGDLLVNNIAWLLRTYPAFPIFGSGKYALQPIAADDLAEVAIACARDPRPALVVDALGPDRFTFEHMVRRIAARVAPGARIIHAPPALGIALGRIIGLVVGDVVLTPDELRGLMDEMLTSTQAPNGTTHFDDWLDLHAGEIGRSYVSELGRHFGPA